MRHAKPEQLGARSTLLLVVVLGAAAGAAAAQNLRGTIVDTAGVRIAGAVITVTAASRSTSLRTSDSGSFEISGIDPPATLSVRAPGFAATTSTWNGEPLLTITLAPSRRDEQIVVTATRGAVPLAEIAASVSNLSPGEFAASPALVLDNVLRQVPGFSLFRRTDSRTANPTSQGVSLRGLGASGASRALVLFDGVPLNDPFGGWVYWDRVPNTDIASVEVLRGGGSSLYGSGALAGVVGVNRRDRRGRSAWIDLSGGAQATANGSATVTERVGNWDLGASAQALRTDGYIPTPRSLRGLADAAANVRFGTGRILVDRRLSTGSVFASVNLFDESRRNGTVLQRNATRLIEGVAGADAAAGGGTINVRSYLSGQHFDQTFSSISLDRNTESLVRVQAVPAQQFGISAVWNRQLGRRNLIALGTDLKRVTGHSSEVLWLRNVPTGTVDAGGRQLYFGVFAEDVLTASSRLHVTAAARVDTWHNFDALSRATTFTPPRSTNTGFPDRSNAALSPSLGAIYQVAPWMAVTGSAYGSFRSPTLNELYRAFRLGNTETLANDSLHPERLRGVEGGVVLGGAPVALRATYFWNTIHDAIGNRTLSTSATLIERQRQNLGDIVARGVELELKARLPHHLSARTAYEFSDSTISRSLERSLLGLRVPQVPRHAVSQSVGIDSPRWAATVVGRYNGRQFEDDLNQSVLPGYFTADTMLRVRLSNLLEPYLACENLLDRGYMVGRTPTPSLGSPRLLRAGIRIRLGVDPATP